MTKTNWMVRLVHKDLEVRVGEHEDPKIIGSENFPFYDKNDAIRFYDNKVNEYIEKSYDFKSHSMACIKAYHDTDDKDILTYVFLLYKNVEYIRLTQAEIDAAMTKGIANS